MLYYIIHSYTHKCTYIHIQTHNYNNSTYEEQIFFFLKYLTYSHYKVKNNTNEVIRAYTSQAEPKFIRT